MTPAEPDVLLATKLEVPPPPPGLVRRPRLLERLAPEAAGAATLVCAPAGFGKTSLLADWARDRGRPVAWVSLDPGDSDPVRFWRYVAAALDRAGVAVAGRLAPLLGGPDPASPEAVDRRDRGPLLVVWDQRDSFTGEDQPPVPFDRPWPAAAATAVDAFGHAQPAEVRDGRLRLAVSADPLFVTA